MATAVTALRRTLQACQRVGVAHSSSTALLRPHVLSQTSNRLSISRNLSTSTTLQARKRRREEGAGGGGEDDGPATLAEFMAEEAASVAPEEQAKIEKLLSESADTIDEVEGMAVDTIRKLDRKMKGVFFEERPMKGHFWFDEDDPDTITNDLEGDEFDEDDITSMAHGKLDEIREYRHYARIAVWEMPLLAKLAKPFQPPTAEQVLRFRYTTYMGERHPAESKVVVQFCPSDLGLTPQQESKLQKLAGPRYNPQRDQIHMSCEIYEHQAQNRRYLEEMVKKLIEAAKDPSETFADIPLDTRHHKFTTKQTFPKEWRMTDARRAEIDEHRARLAAAEAARQAANAIIDGREIAARALETPVPEVEAPVKNAVPVAELVRARGPKKGRLDRARS